MSNEQFQAWRALVGGIARYVRDDQRATYPLPEPVRVTIRSRRVAELPPVLETETGDGSLKIAKKGGSEVEIVAGAFPRESNLWNGPDLIGNGKLRSMLASLFHDLIWGHRTELAEAWNCSEQTVLKWGNDVLYLVWKWASHDSWLGRREAWLAFQACQFAAPWYHKAKQAARLALAAAMGALMLSSCAGCYTLPDGEVTSLDGVETVRGVMDDWGDGLAPLGE